MKPIKVKDDIGKELDKYDLGELYRGSKLSWGSAFSMLKQGGLGDDAWGNNVGFELEQLIAQMQKERGGPVKRTVKKVEEGVSAKAKRAVSIEELCQEGGLARVRLCLETGLPFYIGVFSFFCIGVFNAQLEYDFKAV